MAGADRALPTRRYSLPLPRSPAAVVADAPAGADGHAGVAAAAAAPLPTPATPSGGAARRLANNAAVAGVDDTPATAAATVAATAWPRMDYVVQLESAMEEVSSSYSALKAHTDCWGSRDTALCLLSALLRRAAGSNPANHPRAPPRGRSRSTPSSVLRLAAPTPTAGVFLDVSFFLLL